MAKISIRILSVALAALLLLGSIAVSAAPQDGKKASTEGISFSDSDLISYKDYIKASGLKDSESDIALPLEAFSASDASAAANDGVLIWNDGKGEISFTANVANAGLYNVVLVWKPLTTGVDVDLGVKLDGAFPFENIDKLTLRRIWKNATDKPRTDASGNEYSPEQIETGDYISSYITDDTGVEIEPYKLALTAGSHTISLVAPEQGMEIKSITLKAPEKAKSYKELSSAYKVADLDAEIITIQAENADRKNSNSIIPKSNNSDAGMTPSDPYATKINYIGSTAWQKPGSGIEWDFEVEKSGYYYINMRYKQSDLVNGESLRWLKIDGETPFDEAKAIKFPYDSGWHYYTFGENEEKPYYVWLEKGPHTLSMEATIGDQSEYFNRLFEIVNTLGDEYIKIVMITGETPDANRDYELFKQIVGFNDTLEKCRDGLDSLAKDMKEESGNNSTQSIAAMENMSRVLSQMLKSPYTAQQYVKDYYTNYTSVSSWLYDMTNMPLSLDEIQVVPAGKEFENKKAGFFKSISYSIIRLISSFTRDYSMTKTDGDSKSIRLWVNWGQDQAAILTSLIEDSFTPKTGINVKLEIVSASLINGILAGNFPDLSLHMARTEPVNLGIRGALADLTQFSDYEEVLTRFADGAEIPYTYKDALFALPDTQGFFVMFYRSDILENLGLEVPKTWDEFRYAATIIQRNNMNVYVPYTQIVANTTVNVGIGSLNLFPTLMNQSNLSFYNEDKNATALMDEKAIETFEFWTEFYTEYGYLKEASFYNRFRVGSMPLGIAPLSTYMQLYSTAPEIQDRWGIALVPGMSDGNNSIAGAGSGCAIIEKSPNKKEAWEFLKWWTSADTQARYTRNVESILGMIGRTETANVEAFSALAWESGDLDILNEQRSKIKEVPEIPGSYYLSRALDQAYWAVVNGDSGAKDAITKWSKVADDEIARKIKEYY